jgi:hypothetical protein
MLQQKCAPNINNYSAHSEIETKFGEVYSEEVMPEVKRPGREADHSPPSSAEVKECVELDLHSPIRLHGVVLR